MTPIDNLYYQWAVDDDTRKTPTIFEDIQAEDDAVKINELLGVHAALVAQVIEDEVSHRAIVDTFISRAQEDAGLAECSNTEIAEAIASFDEVVEAEEAVIASSNRLDMFHDNFVAVMAGAE